MSFIQTPPYFWRFQLFLRFYIFTIANILIFTSVYSSSSIITE
jgi:hypothetical protein